MFTTNRGKLFRPFDARDLTDEVLDPLLESGLITKYVRCEEGLNFRTYKNVSEVVIIAVSKSHPNAGILIYTTLDPKTMITRPYGKDTIKAGIFFNGNDGHYYYHKLITRKRTKNALPDLSDAMIKGLKQLEHLNSLDELKPHSGKMENRVVKKKELF